MTEVRHSTKSWSTTLLTGARNNRSPTGAESTLIFVYHDQERQKQHEVWAYLVPLESQANADPPERDVIDPGGAAPSGGTPPAAVPGGAAPSPINWASPATPKGPPASAVPTVIAVLRSPQFPTGHAWLGSEGGAASGSEQDTAETMERTAKRVRCERHNMNRTCLAGFKEAYWHKAHDTLQLQRNGDVWRLVTVHHDQEAGKVHEVWECRCLR